MKKINPSFLYTVGKNESIWSIAFNDIADGACNYRLWAFLGWQDIRQRYRRSVLGPFWLTLSTGVMVAMMTVLYGRMFKLPLDIYAPYLAVSTIVWTLIAALLNEGCTSFMAADSLIKQVRLPLSLHVCRVVWRNIIVFFHNVVILLPVWLIFAKPISLSQVLLIFFALLIIASNGFFTGILLGAVCARFRDVGPIVTNFVQIVFFVTPIMWLPSILEGRGVEWWLVTINPFYHLIEIVRAPFLGKPLPITSWEVAIMVTLLNQVLGAAMLGKFKSRIAYWL